MDFSKKLNELPKDVLDFFASNEPRTAIERACFLYDVKEEDIKKLSTPIAQIFFKDAPLKDLPLMIERDLQADTRIAHGIAYELNSKIFSPYGRYFIDAPSLLVQWRSLKSTPLISEEKARQRVLDLEPWILEQEKEEKKQTAVAGKNLENISIDEALEKYPDLGEQQVSNNPLKLRQFSMSVRPSIKNWITDFHDNMGAGKHSSIDRGNYLFHSDNGKKLTPIERRKISAILRSLDEKTPLKIDSQSQAVVFEANIPEENAQVSQQPQESVDVFQRYAAVGQQAKPKQSFSPNFAKPSPQSDEQAKPGLKGIFSREQKEDQVARNKPGTEEPWMAQMKASAGSGNYFSNFASSQADGKQPGKNTAGSEPAAPEGVVRFSSPQKLPVEQSASPVKQALRPVETPKQAPVRPTPPPQIQPQPQPKAPAQPIPDKEPQKMSPQQSQWHIGPTRHFEDEETDGKEPKISGNTVDLKN